jgi:hypothetical protein
MASWHPKLIQPANTKALVKTSPVTVKTALAVALMKAANRD